MANGDKGSGGYGGFGGLGQPGTRETKVFGETSEVKIPRKQMLELWAFSFLILILGYACLKLIITSRGDWSLVIGILTIIGIPAFALFFERRIAFRYFPNVYDDILNWIYNILHTDDLGRLILFLFFVSVALLVSIGFYLSVIVTQLTLILDSQAQYVFVFLAFFSLLFAFMPYYQFNKRQLTDSLRDSDSHYATRALELEYERKKSVEEKMDALRAIGIREEPKDVMVHPYILSAPVHPTAPATEAQTKFRDAVFDFLDGIDEGRWDTSERSWRNELGQPKILERSRFRLLKLGPEIRDKLIERGWAEWKLENDHSAGWQLLFSTDEIREGGFNGGSEFKDAGRDGEDTGAGAFENG